MGNVFSYFAPTRIFYGKGALKNLEEYSQVWKRPLLVTFKELIDFDFFQKIIKILKSSTKTDPIIFSEVKENPSSELIMSGADVANYNDVDVVIGIGGGSAIDSAKGIAIMKNNKGDILDYCFDPKLGRLRTEITSNILPIIAIPTTAGTGSEVTWGGVISNPKNKIKEVFVSPDVAPSLALVDPALTVSLPSSITIYTGIDALTQCIESFISKNHHPISDTLALEGIKRASSLPLVIKNPDDLEARLNMSISATLSGMAMINTGVGAAHALAMVLGGQYNIPHGLAISLVLREVLKYNFGAIDETRLSLLVGAWTDRSFKSGSSARDWFINNIERLLDDLGVNTRLNEFGIEQSELRKIASLACQHFDMVPNPRTPTVEDIIGLLEKIL